MTEQPAFEALRMASYCKRALEDRNRRVGLVNEVEFLVEGNVIAIPGTDTPIFTKGLWDMVRNFRFIPWYDERTGWCHAGMLKGARAVVREVIPYLSENPALPRIDGRTVVHVTGHSMGGGIGFLAAIMLADAGFLVEFTGFGAPRVMIGKRRRLKFQARFFRNANDIVPLVPPWFMGFRKNPNELRLEEKSQGQIADHDISSYIINLKQLF